MLELAKEQIAMGQTAVDKAEALRLLPDLREAAGQAVHDLPAQINGTLYQLIAGTAQRFVERDIVCGDGGGVGGRAGADRARRAARRRAGAAV